MKFLFNMQRTIGSLKAAVSFEISAWRQSQFKPSFLMPPIQTAFNLRQLFPDSEAVLVSASARTLQGIIRLGSKITFRPRCCDFEVAEVSFLCQDDSGQVFAGVNPAIRLDQNSWTLTDSTMIIHIEAVGDIIPWSESDMEGTFIPLLPSSLKP